MREIKFRGITFKGDWVYGDIHTDLSGLSFNEKEWIRNNITENKNESRHTAYWQQTTKRIAWIEGTAYCNAPVIPETLGQYTGLTDKNGKGIYEGDIVVEAGEKREIKYGYCELDTDGGTGDYAYGFNLYHDCSNIEVIGNIHQNMELLKKQQK